MKIGVLAVQGAFAEHIAILHRLDVDAVPIRLPHELISLDGLIIPGGESTSISKLMLDFNLMNEVRNLAKNGLLKNAHFLDGVGCCVFASLAG